MPNDDPGNRKAPSRRAPKRDGSPARRAKAASPPAAPQPPAEPGISAAALVPAVRVAAAARAAPPAGSRISDDDLHLFHEGNHFHVQDRLGSHPGVLDGIAGCHFAVFAPNAQSVSVMGDFNGWDKRGPALSPRGASGVWEGFVPGLGAGTVYKYHLVSRLNGYRVDKADPFAFRHETPPRTASVVHEPAFVWNDEEWMAARAERQRAGSPLSIYEVHTGSWRRGPGGRMLRYRELAGPLASYAREMGFTHVELMPVMEHPYYPSWGYQVTGYFAPTSRQGTPEDFQALVDELHRAGIGVILDWVPSHFPTDEHGLGYFDGTHLYEHADPRQGFHPDWKSAIFNYGRPEVKSFLISSALFWIEAYHADGLRVDGVASMLHLDYSRKAGEWIPNAYGGRENLDAIAFLRRMNDHILGTHPDVLTIAEESHAWPMVTRPTHIGGLGFRMKWDMGWMNDALEYMELDPILRAYNHGLLTFRPMYAYTENFLLPLSHDEVVHMKGSLLLKMPGDDWQRFANLRLLLAFQAALPGKKLLFMGGEIGQWAEWDHDASVQWHLLDAPGSLHEGVRRWAADLNRMHSGEPAMHELDFDPAGFQWIDFRDSPQSVLAFLRMSHGGDSVLAAFNFTPVPRPGYRFGVPRKGLWREIANSDAGWYGGSGLTSGGGAEAEEIPHHGRPFSVTLTLPPLAAVFLKAPPAPPPVPPALPDAPAEAAADDGPGSAAEALASEEGKEPPDGASASSASASASASDAVSAPAPPLPGRRDPEAT